MESLLKDKDLITVIKDLVRGSGRSYPLQEPEVSEGKGTVPEKQQAANGLEKVPQTTQTNGISKKETVAVL